MAKFDLNLLEALDALLTERHVTRAAEAMHVSQPTMSGMLQRLRYQFRDEILVRVGRNMELTPFAATLALPVREALLGLNLLTQAVPSFDPSTSTRSFVLMASDYCVATFMPRILRRLSAEAPFMRVEVQALDGPIPKLVKGDIDLCITVDSWDLLRIDEPKDLLRSDTLFSDDFVCVVDQDHPIGDSPSVSEYFGYPHVQVKVSGGLFTPEQISIQDHMPRYQASFTVADFMSIPYVVQGSNAIGVVQRRLAEAVCNTLSLRSFAPPIPIAPIHETIIWHARSTDDSAHTWLRALITREAQLAKAGPGVVSMPTKRRTAKYLDSPTTNIA